MYAQLNVGHMRQAKTLLRMSVALNRLSHCWLLIGQEPKSQAHVHVHMFCMRVAKQMYL